MSNYKEVQSKIARQDLAHEHELEESRKYIHINVGFNQWDNNYNCTALVTNRAGAIYAYKHQHAIHISIGFTDYLVTSNFGITHAQADNLCIAHANGKFKKEDTSSWD